MVQIMVNKQKKIGAVDMRSEQPRSGMSDSFESDPVTVYSEKPKENRPGYYPVDLKPGYWYGDQAAVYLNSTVRKIALYRKYDLLKFCKFGKNYVYKKEWLDEFCEEWSGFDLSNENKVKAAIAEKKWRKAHGKMGY